MSAQFAKPYTCIMINAPGHVENDRYVPSNYSQIKDTLINLGYLVNKIIPVCSAWGFRALALVEFGDSPAHAESAFKLQQMFARQNHTRADWLSAQNVMTRPYLWVATADDQVYLPTNTEYVQVPYAIKIQANDLADAEQTNGYNSVSVIIEQMQQLLCHSIAT